MIDPGSPDFTNTPASGRRPSFGYRPAGAPGEPAVTIVTPFHDTDPALFAETAASVLRQSLQAWEWVIVDDGSTRAESLAALAEHARCDHRIRVVRHERNRGVPAARNTGIASARSAFVLQIDSDDLLEPTAAEKWLWFLASHPRHAFVNGFQVGFGVEEYLWPRGFGEREAFLGANLSNPAGIARRELFERVGGYDETLREGLEDWEFWLRCAAAGSWGSTIPEYLVWHRRKGGDAERWANWDQGPRQAELLAEWRRRYPRLWRRGFPRLPRPKRSWDEVELDALPFENRLEQTARRLLLLAPWAAMGGADKFNIDLVAQLRGRGWETTVVTTRDGDHTWLPRLAALTPDVFALARFVDPDDRPRFLKYLIESRSPDAILVSHSLLAYQLLPYLRTVASGAPIVDYSHLVEETWLDGGYARLSVEAGDLIDLRIVSSENLRVWMTQEGLPAERIEVAYINVEPDGEGGRSRAELELPGDRYLLLYAGRICAQKQPDVFAKTLERLRGRGVPFLALVAGDGPDLPWLRRYVRRRGLEPNVRFLGRQAPEAVRELMGAVDVVFLPSKYEGVALTLYEAMASGTPVVAADVGGQRELVTPECGVLLRPGGDGDEATRYADVLEELLGDEERRREMGRRGRERIASSFTLDQMGRRMDALLEHARELARSTPGLVPPPAEARRAALTAIASARPFAARRRPAAAARLLVLRAIAATARPLYRRVVARAPGLERLKRRLVKTLLPRD